MPRDARAYLADILESCDAIALAVRELDLDADRDVPILRRECAALMDSLESGGKTG